MFKMELIKVQEKNGQKVVSARELYKFLEVKTAFKDWMPRMLEYGFQENVDFSSFLSESNGGRPAKDYALTLDTAKEISMLQRSEKGKQARQYFIECEKNLKQITNNIPGSFSEALKLAYEQSLKIEQQQKLLDNQKPLVVFAEALQVSNDSILIGELAKLLKQNKIEIGQNRLFSWLRDKNYLLSRGEQKNLPSQQALNLGLFEIKTTTITSSDGITKVNKTTKVTPKGQQYFINKFLS